MVLYQSISDELLSDLVTDRVKKYTYILIYIFLQMSDHDAG